MKRKMRGGWRLTLVSSIAVLASLGAIPALASEGPLVTVPTTTLDAEDPTPRIVDDVTGAVATTVDPVSNAASVAVGPITDGASDGVGAAASSAGSVPGTVTGGTWIADADVGSATTGQSGPAEGSPSHEVTSSEPARGANSPRSGWGYDPLTTLADGAEHSSRATLETTHCPDAGGSSCSPPTPDGDSLAEKIAEVIGQLAVTGFMLLPLIAAALVLTFLGSIALERSRRGTQSHAGV